MLRRCEDVVQFLLRPCLPEPFDAIEATMQRAHLSLRPACALVLLALAGAGRPTTGPADPFAPLRNKEVLFNGWGISPAGKHVRIGSIPLKMIVSPDGKRILSTSAGANPGISVVDPQTMAQTQWIPLPRAFNGLAFSLDGKHVFATGGNSSAVHCFDYADGTLGAARSISLVPEPRAGRRAADDSFLSGIAVHPTTGDLYLCSEATNEIWVVDPARLLGGQPDAMAPLIRSTIPVGGRPYACAFGADHRHLYVSNWADRTLSIVDSESARVVGTVPVGVRPNDLTLAPDGRLFVACSGDNTVHVVQTRTVPKGPRETDQSAPPDESALEIISTALYPQSPEGSTPVGVAVSPDGKFLYVVNADNNDAMVADISDAKLAKVLGFVPVGWYPTAVLAWKNQLVVGNGKGLASRENFPPRLPAAPNAKANPRRYDGEYNIFEGWMSFIDPSAGTTLDDYTARVRANSPYTPETLRRPISAPADSPVPAHVGGESPIKHIVYVIKENRTYDQVFGDFTDASGKHAGNGDPNLTLFGEKITPNQHRLARDYVLLDNFYCNGEVSVDGHSWCDAAIATDANQKGWIVSYSGHGKLPLAKDLSNPTAGFIWDLCRRGGVPFKCYGEGVASVANENRGTWSAGRDPEKVDAFISDLARAEKTGQLPAFMIMSLGENHTKGTTPGAHTPAACVASNDLAVGKLVEALSKSKFWGETAVFIVEDDAQNGPDHVDSHRTCALVVSPWVKRNTVDSTPYTQASMLRTMELILGLPPMTQYDAGATPMYNSFQPRAQSVVFSAKVPDVDLAATNTASSPGAKISSTMDFDDYDDAPEDPLNRVLWLAMKGPDVPYPTPVRRAILLDPQGDSQPAAR